MNLVLHIGPYKTGSSAIQQTLKDSRDLLVSNGIYYPLTKNEGKNLNQLASKLYHNKADLPILISNIKIEAKDLGCHTVFISAETLWNIKIMYDWHNKNEIDRTESQILFDLKIELSKHFNDIKIIYFFRNNSDLYSSFYNQLVKDVTDLSSTFFQFKKSFKNFFNYDLTIDVWKNVFVNSEFHKFIYRDDVVGLIFDYLNIKTPASELKNNVRFNNDLLFVKWLSNSEIKFHSYRAYKWKKFIKMNEDKSYLNNDLSFMIYKLTNEILTYKLLLYVIAKKLDNKFLRILISKLRK